MKANNLDDGTAIVGKLIGSAAARATERPSDRLAAWFSDAPDNPGIFRNGLQIFCITTLTRHSGVFSYRFHLQWRRDFSRHTVTFRVTTAKDSLNQNFQLTV